ncbi:MAG: hypothetical protein E7092_03370 [Bacteroidales bacterium]|nr:hypothetical protein [Bacteroidales bacterium]
MINRKKEPSAELTKTMEEELQDLYRYAFYRLGDEQDAEDIIQDLYISIHEKHDAASNIGNLRNYIYRALPVNFYSVYILNSSVFKNYVFKDTSSSRGGM